MEIRKLNAARGWVWIKQGYQLIMRSPLMSVVLALIAAASLIATLNIPLFGPLLAVLLMPVLMIGYMRACRALEEEEEVELAHLFEGFRKNTAQLVTLGGFIMLGLLLTSAAMTFVGGDALAKMLQNFQASSDPQMLAEAMLAAGSDVTLSLLVGFTLILILTLALQYAPMLVFFQGVSPVAALRASMAGSLRNIAPYAVYSIIMQLLAGLLGMIPFGLGLIVLLPLGLTSLYVSYRNIFPFAGEIQAPANKAS